MSEWPGSGFDAAPEDTPGTFEYNSREAYLQQTQARIDASRPVGGADPGGYPLGGGAGSRVAKRPALSKWVWITVPLGVLVEMMPLHGPHGSISGFAKFALAVGIAGLGSPRARAASICVLVLLAAAALWVWS